jgi:ABC-type bacteriocin/lantibiotic exporter with double-glycine peptidase domain
LFRFLSFLTPHRSTVFWTIVASFVLSGLGIAGSYYYRFLVDEVLMAGSRLTVHVITGSFMVLALLQGVAGGSAVTNAPHLRPQDGCIDLFGGVCALGHPAHVVFWRPPNR